MDIGDRMKEYEGVEAGRRFLPQLSVVARMDGKCFHTWTKNLIRPYDTSMIELMQRTTKRLVEETNACIGYTQSDEITLVFYSDNYKSQIYFDGRIQKMVSVLASETTAMFNELARVSFPDKKSAIFDARVWQMPSLIEAANCVMWRERDAVKNSISMAAQEYFSHKQLHKKNTDQMQDMLMREHQVNWNDYPPCFKRGTYYHRKKKNIKFTSDEIDKLPEKHEAKLNPNLMIERSVVEELDIISLAKITNKVDVIFYGAEPVYRSAQ